MRREQDSDNQYINKIISLEKKGHNIVKLIVIINGLFILMDLIIPLLLGEESIGLIIKTMFWFFVLFMLYSGKSWAKWIFIISASINALLFLFSLPYLAEIMAQEEGALFHIILGIVATIIFIISSLFLLFSTAVKEFLIGQDTGY